MVMFIQPIISEIIVGREGQSSTSSSQMEIYLHELGHKAALFFVIPVGSTAIIMNFVNKKRNTSKRRYITTMISIIGLMLVFLANSGGNTCSSSSSSSSNSSVSISGEQHVHHHHNHSYHHSHHHHHHHHHHDEHHQHYNDIFVLIGQILSAIQNHGIIHRLVNVSGCFLMLGSNYFAGCGEKNGVGVKFGCAKIGCNFDHTLWRKKLSYLSTPAY